MTGFSLTDARFISRLNLAIQELMFEGDFPGVVDRWLFKADQNTGIVALPYVFDRLMQVTVDGVPDTIVSPWFEFYGYGPGIQDDYDAYGNRRYDWALDIFDRGDSPVVTQIPDFNDDRTGPWVLRVYATVAEASGATINIQGLDANGLIIRTLSSGTWYNGLNVAINHAVPYTQTTQQFSKITGVVKPETNGYVRLTAWNGSVEVELSNYAFNETAPSYRHYYIPRIHNRGYSGVRERIVIGRCRKRFVPVEEDNDLLIISNINALKSMMVAQWKRDAGGISLDEFSFQKQVAVDILKKETTGYLGKTKIPSITMQRGFSIGAVQYIR